MKLLITVLVILIIGLSGLVYYRYAYYPSLGRLGIGSRPVGVDVYIEGEMIGRTPVEFERKDGEYRIKLEKEGYKSIEEKVEVKAGQFEVVGYILEKIE